MLPHLPDHIMKLERNIYIRIFKLFGPLSIFLVFSQAAKQCYPIFCYIIYIYSFIYILYRIMLAFYAIKQWVINLISGYFIVRYSPSESPRNLVQNSSKYFKRHNNYHIRNWNDIRFSLRTRRNIYSRAENKKKRFLYQK